jgi:hypothetical protein
MKSNPLSEKNMQTPGRLFSATHLFFNYLPRRIAITVIPVGLLVAFATKSETSRLVFLLYSVIMSAVQVFNYSFAAYRHSILLKDFGDEYLDKLEGELERVGLNRLIDRFWTGLEPD